MNHGNIFSVMVPNREMLFRSLFHPQLLPGGPDTSRVKTWTNTIAALTAPPLCRVWCFEKRDPARETSRGADNETQSFLKLFCGLVFHLHHRPPALWRSLSVPCLALTLSLFISGRMNSSRSMQLFRANVSKMRLAFQREKKTWLNTILLQ